MRYAFGCVLLLFVLNGTANNTLYPFADSAAAQRFSNLIAEFRCLVCQNENLADSSAALASDLRQQVYQMVLANKDNASIKQYLITRYGDFVLYDPPLQTNTLLLWLGPLLLLGVGFITWLLWLRRGRA